jgi:hypothetical protein
MTSKSVVISLKFKIRLYPVANQSKSARLHLAGLKNKRHAVNQFISKIKTK